MNKLNFMEDTLFLLCSFFVSCSRLTKTLTLMDKNPQTGLGEPQRIPEPTLEWA